MQLRKDHEAALAAQDLNRPDAAAPARQQHADAVRPSGPGRHQVSDLSFKVAKRRTDAITFDLEGSAHVYSFVPPKQAAMILPMLDAESDLEAAKAAFEWLDTGLSQEDQDHLSGRLKDPKDDLDIDILEEVVSGLVERVSGRPTT